MHLTVHAYADSMAVRGWLAKRPRSTIRLGRTTRQDDIMQFAISVVSYYIASATVVRLNLIADRALNVLDCEPSGQSSTLGRGRVQDFLSSSQSTRVRARQCLSCHRVRSTH